MNRRLTLWLLWALVVTVTAALVGAASSVLVDRPTTPLAGTSVGIVVFPSAWLMARWQRSLSVAERVLVRTIVVAGLVLMTGGVYLFVVLGLGRVPEGDERTILALSVAAALITCLLAFPARRRLEEWANQQVHGERRAPEEALRTFGNRMSRAVPMDELLLQLAETLRGTLDLSTAEIWTGDGGRLVRTVSVPERPMESFELRGEELAVVARAHAQGNAWLTVWAPAVLAGREDMTVRSVSVTHLGELLGLIVLERNADAHPFTEAEDRMLVDLARQVGLALHNVRLDSALQASLDELQVRNAELVASRARIVAAADESRRQIERNLHDGAQQHLVALAVKVGLVKTLIGSDPDTADALLGELRGDVQATLTELRELAHGIYPPLLRDRGLGEALQAAANRAVLPTTVSVEGDGRRYDTDVEAAVYFCCLEAMQNAGKYAGDHATVAVSVGVIDGDTSALWFQVHDDGVGFDAATAVGGHGFINMVDRLGALDGSLTVTSDPKAGTTVRGELPASSV